MEIELKLALDPAGAGLLGSAAALAGVRPRNRRMYGIYLDTPDCELVRAGAVLRLRREGARWVQCLKAGRSGTGGLHARGEWEIGRRGPEVDLSLFRDTPLADVPDAATLHQRLAPVFVVDVRRTTWQLVRRGASFEVALDLGTVASGARHEPVCEVEIECLEGHAVAAYDLADALAKVVALRPSSVSKAERGYRLFRNEAPRPMKALAPAVSADMTPAQAARAIVAAGIAQLQGNEEGLLASDDPEFVHQARVALRRTRAALRLLRKSIGAKRADAWRDELGTATRALGAARDWDVFATQTLTALTSAYGDANLARRLARRAKRKRDAAREDARRAIRSRRYARAILHVSRWIAEEPGPASPRTPALAPFAALLLDKRHDRLAAGLAHLPGLDIAERHRVRIRAKRLRYVVEGLAPALDARAAKAYSRTLAALQDALGRANDAVTGERLLREIGPPAPVAMFARGWFAARERADAPRLRRVAAAASAAERFWRI